MEHDAAYSALMILSGVGEMKEHVISAYDLSSSFPDFFFNLPPSVFFSLFNVLFFLVVSTLTPSPDSPFSSPAVSPKFSRATSSQRQDR